MASSVKIMIIAGEASGDILGADLMEALRAKLGAQGQSVEFIGIGGDMMAVQGLESLFPMKELSIMGIVEILPHIPNVLRRIKQTVAYADAQKPDLLITIDAPDFCHRVAKKVKKNLNIPCIHYVSPSIWAWRRGRVYKMAQYLDHVLALFPFEPEFYKDSTLKCTFVGHPVVQRLEAHHSEGGETHKDALIIMPGSRNREIETLLPLFYEASQHLKAQDSALKPVFIFAHEQSAAFAKSLLPDLENHKCVVGEERYQHIKGAKMALVASGTANLELAVLGVPMVVAYKTGWLTALIARKLIQVPYISPVNWVLGRKAIPELLQEEATLENMQTQSINLWQQPEEQRKVLQTVKDTLNTGSPSQKAADVVLTYL